MDNTTLPYQIFCVSIERCKERRRRIVHRFGYHNLKLGIDYKFVDAHDYNSPFVAILCKGYEGSITPEDEKGDKLHKTAACLASHLKAIREYIEDPNLKDTKGVIICEDDIMLHNDFRKLLNKCFSNVPADTGSVMLSHMHCFGGKSKWAGIKPRLKNLIATSHKIVFGCQMYWLSRNKAITALKRLDRKLVDIEEPNHEFLTSEMITENSLLAHPLLAIEDCILSEIHPDHQYYHMLIYRTFSNPYDYEKCLEPGAKTPLFALLDEQPPYLPLFPDEYPQ